MAKYASFNAVFPILGDDASSASAHQLRQMSASMYNQKPQQQQQQPRKAPVQRQLSGGNGGGSSLGVGGVGVMSSGSLQVRILRLFSLLERFCHDRDFQNVSGASLSAFEDSPGPGGGGGGAVEYPPLAPRPKLAPRPSAGSLRSAQHSHSQQQQHHNSSSSSVESLVSSTGGGGGGGGGKLTGAASAPLASTRQPPGGAVGAPTPPSAAPRSSLTATSSAPPGPTHGSGASSAVPESSPSSASNASSSGTAAGSSTGGGPGGTRTVRTLYACVAEHETELSFEPNQIITSGELVSLIKLVFNEIKMFAFFYPQSVPLWSPAGWRAAWTGS